MKYLLCGHKILSHEVITYQPFEFIRKYLPVGGVRCDVLM